MGDRGAILYTDRSCYGEMLTIIPKLSVLPLLICSDAAYNNCPQYCTTVKFDDAEYAD